MRRGLVAGVMALAVASTCQSRSQTARPAPTDWSPRPARDLGVEVARVAGRPIFAAEVAAQSARTGLSAKGALEQLIRFELLAERAGPRRVPAPDLTTQRLRVERLLEQELEPGLRQQDVPEADLHKLYQQNLPKFVHPRLVEVALLSVYTGPGMKPAPRARAEATAHDLYEYIKKRPIRTADDFKEIAKDKAWGERKVAYWHLVQGPDRRYGPFGENVGGALQKLRSKDETSPLIIDDSGFHIARYIDEKPPLDVPYEKARAELLAGYYPIWRKQRFIDWTNTLGNAHGVEVFTERLLATEVAEK